MSCNHANPAWHRFCVVCGENLHRLNCPRCGAVCEHKYLHCHACGQTLHLSSENSSDNPKLIASTYPLETLLQSSNNQRDGNVKIEKVSGKMTQDDIKKLLAQRQKKNETNS